MMMPESFHYDQTLSNPTLNDPVAAANVVYIGGHLYGADIQDYPLAHSLVKHTWMTEYLVNDQTINAAVDTTQQISDTLTVGNMSAYIWWKTIGDANGLLNAAGVLQPRAYVMSQFRITSAAQSLEQLLPLDVGKGVFTYTVPSFWVVTFTGILQKLTMCQRGDTISIDRNAVSAHLCNRRSGG
jgi:hypothetical protein